MDVAIYLRKSRNDIEAELKGEEETLKRHEKVLLELANKLNLNILHIYKEIVSGESIASRPVMQELISDVEKGLFDGVLVIEIERLARGDTMDQGIVAQTFKYSNTKIITPIKTYDPQNEFDEEYFEFGLFMSRREYKTINRRLQSGRLASVKEGKYVGNIPPYGYVRKSLEGEKGYTLEPHTEQADIVKFIYKLYTVGELQEDNTLKTLGASLIAKKLNDLNIPTVKGGVWTPPTIRGILSNPVYIGKIRWNSRAQVKKLVDGKMIKERPRANDNDILLVDGLHPAIIDEESFKLARKISKKNTIPRLTGNKSLKNPFSGIVACGFCGRKMIRRPYKNNYPDILMCSIPSCPNVSSALHLVEEKILQALQTWLNKYYLEFNLNESNNKPTDMQTDLLRKSIVKLTIQIERIQNQISNLHDLLELGVYNIEVFADRSKVLNKRLKILENDKKYIQEKMTRNENKNKTTGPLVPKVQKILEAYHYTKDPAIKNKLLNEVLDKVVYIKTISGRWHTKPDDFNLKLYPKLPK
ncbi:recombinase family protein [Alkaliphilus transvaalensis]|uniref:recombinase family protein n=1 Tax=Alkaliphilus transvaalensis TaxID=114628 RepID=UPI00047C408F|nr:recombinase family protein [Alkaliphilus transvaalensis]